MSEFCQFSQGIIKKNPVFVQLNGKVFNSQNDDNAFKIFSGIWTYFWMEKYAPIF